LAVAYSTSLVSHVAINRFASTEQSEIPTASIREERGIQEACPISILKEKKADEDIPNIGLQDVSFKPKLETPKVKAQLARASSMLSGPTCSARSPKRL